MARQLRLVMAQLNLLAGDIAGNADRVLDTAKQAIAEHQADVVVYPELALTAYPPEDLLLRPALATRVDDALAKICEAALPAWLVIGFPLYEQGRLFNALAVIHGGGIQAIYRKQCLPNYQVFDERRYFSAGDAPCLVDIEGVKTAFTICEDIWEAGPTRQAAQAGAALMININASPFHLDKMERRLALLADRAASAAMPIVYVNQVGGQDELVFDGNSMIADASGEVQVCGPAFAEALIPVALNVEADAVTFANPLTATTALPGIESRCYQAMALGLRDYLRKNGFKKVLLGLSGGIDSALTLAVAVDALGAENVSAVMMPYDYTSPLSLQLAEQQATRLGVDYQIIAINDIYRAFESALAAEFAGMPPDLTEQNIQARCRGTLLMAISNKKGALVVTTGNKSELAVGYCTLYGDMVGAFSVLKDASKTLVYRLARYRNEVAAEAGETDIIPQGVIDRPPSAELAPDQRDDDNLPPYDRLDAIMAMYVEQDMSAEAIIRSGQDRDEVYRVLRLIDINEYKRRQAPIGVRLTERAFGRDRRYPLTHGWKIGD
ncbi:NAD+ synthase [Pseudohongiella sp. SYSU M77423]|uniref:NAD+ synthase n=1 Tax=Pseudohongiella sp. SYSU M77423 TaxID=3042312 RepID=UPI0024801C32|nr:NAD+ synthase [Pseudohongiella sp. SYSU M77423]MDH7944448.1 NAD+ synthase [Pseudohongiella sp. SYSU M77423]MEC8858594.1 NAD+ synthase [Pseudomonadota bacterium]